MQKGSATVGIKASLIEWERAGGVDRFASGLRTAEYVSNYLDVLRRVAQGLSRHEMDSNDEGRFWQAVGSWELGLRECIGMGWRLQDLDGASYTPSVCAGFSARVEGVRKHGTQKSVASATLED